MVDVEVRRYGLEAKVAELARRLGIPVVTTFMGRGLLASADAPLAGTYLGVAGDPAITARSRARTALLLLGVILSDTNFGVSAGQLDLRRTIQALDRQVSLASTAIRISRWATWSTPCSRACQRAGRARAARRAAGLSARTVADDAPIAPDRTLRAASTICSTGTGRCRSRRHGRLPVHRHGHRRHRRWSRPATTPAWASASRPASAPRSPPGAGADPGRRRRLPDDRLGARQLPPARHRPDRHPVQQHELGDAARASSRNRRFNDLDDWHFADIAAALGGDRPARRHPRRARRGARARRGDAAARFQLIEAMLPRGAISATLRRFVAGDQAPAAAKEAPDALDPAAQARPPPAPAAGLPLRGQGYRARRHHQARRQGAGGGEPHLVPRRRAADGGAQRDPGVRHQHRDGQSLVAAPVSRGREPLPARPHQPARDQGPDRQDQRRPALRDFPRGPAQRHRRPDEDLCRPGLHRRPQRRHDPAGAPGRARAGRRSAGCRQARSRATGSPRSPSRSAPRASSRSLPSCVAKPGVRSRTCSSTTSCPTWCS